MKKMATILALLFVIFITLNAKETPKESSSESNSTWTVTERGELCKSKTKCDRADCNVSVDAKCCATKCDKKDCKVADCNGTNCKSDKMPKLDTKCGKGKCGGDKNTSKKCDSSKCGGDK